MSTTYHIRIKKDYASALIEDLQKADAIEVIEQEIDNGFEIQDWQKDVVLTRLKNAERNPEQLLPWSAATKHLYKSGE